MSEISFFILSLASLFAIINPFSTALIFITIGKNSTLEWKKSMAKRACTYAAAILILSTYTGYLIFNFFNISLSALEISSGIILLFIGFKMVNPLLKQKEILPEHKKEVIEKEDISLVPLAIPFISGPAAIATTVTLSLEGGKFGGMIVILSIIIISILTYVLLLKANSIKRFLKDSGTKAVEKVMGLIILALGTQFVLNGIKGFIGSF